MPQHHQQAPNRWLLVSDIDDTLIGDNASLRRFCRLAENADTFRLVLNSSRPIESIKMTLEQLDVQLPAAGIIGAMGTEMLLDGDLYTDWQESFDPWDRSIIDRIMMQIGAVPHANEYQTPYKASFAVGRERQREVMNAIAESGLSCKIVVSGESDFDILPEGAGKGRATLKCAERLGFSRQKLIVAGDSANDIDLFNVSPRGILVGNARNELRQGVDAASTYTATQPFAAGVIEGLLHWGVIEP